MERQYKDSGTKGIGLIPQSWDSRQLGIFFSENRRANSYLESVTALQFKYGEIIQKPNNGRELNDKDKELLSKYTVIEPGDVIVNGLNLNFDLKSLRIAIARENGIITSAYIVLRPRKGVNPEYYNYVLKALDFQKILHGMGEGIRLTLSYDELKKLNVPAPDSATQTIIVSNLDEKCGEIDSLIALQEQMIEKLKAYKQSVITEAVTKGLDPNAKLVPSGIDWIGEIPEEWKVLKTLFTLKMPITDGPHTTPKLFDNGIPFVSAEAVSCGNGSIDFDHIRGFISQEFYEECCLKYIPEIDDVYMIKSGATTGKVSIVDTDKVFTIWSPLAVFRSNRNIIIPRFMFYTLQGDYYQKQISLYWTFGTQQNIGMRTLEQLAIVLPPLSEQQTIASYLDEKCADIDRLIALKQQKIETLKDYKKSVIYEAVTGKTFL